MSAHMGQVMANRISGRGGFPRPVTVDEQDLHLFTDHNWTDNGAGYIVAGERGSGRKLYLHRMIAGASNGQVVDHINGDTCDNRRANLRIVTLAENSAQFRKKIARANTNHPVSKYVGVAWHSTAERWIASCRSKYCGLFESEEDAARAADAERAAVGLDVRYPDLGIITREQARARRSSRKSGPKMEKLP